MKYFFFSFLTALIVIACSVERQESQISLVNESEIYELIQFIVANQKLDSTYGFDLRPESPEFDSIFLVGMLPSDTTDDFAKIDTVNGKFELTVKKTFSFNSSSFEECLLPDDIPFMLTQLRSNREFLWDSSKFSFDKKNRDHWYSISVPVFSLDKSTALVTIEKLCPGLCGTGYNLLLKKDNGAWTASTSGGTWIH